MLWLRGLAVFAGAGVLAMTAVMAVPMLRTARITFRPDIASETFRLASNQANSALRFAMGAAMAPAQAQPAIPDPAQALHADALNRLTSKISADLYPYFDVYLYVSKAASGSLAQRMYVFHKDTANNLVFEESFPVSTGRERHEKYFTSTPIGLFELDPNRIEQVHYSRTWHGAAMPWAMFLNATIRGRLTGVALHSAVGHTAQLGTRASGGCVRLPPDKAAELFNRFQREEHGVVPVFAYDELHRRTNPDGMMLRDTSSKPVLADGYRVLLFIEDYPGGPALVAVLT